MKITKKNDNETINDNKILKLNIRWIAISVIRADTMVPDHVFLGLTDGIIKGPLIKLPKI